VFDEGIGMLGTEIEYGTGLVAEGSDGEEYGGIEQGNETTSFVSVKTSKVL
jgi:hypothetical protein